MPIRRYDISNTVLDQGKELGLTEPVLDTVKHMLVNSARVTHKLGNRRYENYLFNIVNHVVCSLVAFEEAPEVEPEGLYACSFCKDTRRVNVYESCVSCDGTGQKAGTKCKNCNAGEVLKSIPCQDCQKAKRYPS